MAVSTIDNTVRVETVDEAGSALTGGSGGDTSNYDATPGDGSWGAAPDSGSEATFTPAFTPSGFTAYVKTFAVEIRVSFDGGATFGEWIVLEPGVHSFPGFAATDIEIREDVNLQGGEYQIVAVA